MANTLAFKESTSLMHVFDLKGSRVNRREKLGPWIKPTSVLKDLNFLSIESEKDLVHFLPNDRAELQSILDHDS